MNRFSCFVSWFIGQMIPSIKKRFFVLERGMLSYYKEDIVEKNKEDQLKEEASPPNDTRTRRRSSTSKRRIPKPLGKFCIYDYTIYSDIRGGKIELLLVPG
jgi:hypothetical protein